MSDTYTGRQYELYYKNIQLKLHQLYLWLYLLKGLVFVCFQSIYNTFCMRVGVLVEMHLSQEIESCVSQETSNLQNSGNFPNLILPQFVLSHFSVLL